MAKLPGEKFIKYGAFKKQLGLARRLTSTFNVDAITYRKIKRNCAHRMAAYEPARLSDLKPANPHVPPNPIWVCWLQGMEKAPELVKVCFESLQRHAGGHEIILLTEKNLHEYVNFPNHINEKYKEGDYPIQQFADMLRAAVIFNWGGLWVDATMYLTETIPPYIWQGDLFLFKYITPTKQMCSNQFMYARPHNPIMGKTLDAMLAYWKHHDEMITYFQFHYFMAVAIREEAACLEMYDAVPNFYSENNHVLGREMFDEFDPIRWEQLKQFSFIHKLSYKWPAENAQKPNTYYRHILERKSDVID